MTALPLSFLTRPIAHRGLHDVQNGRPENSSAAIAAAISKGYGIEIDVQLSKDGAAMVFHDYHLNRLTGQKGAIAQSNAEWLSKVALSGGTGTITTLKQTLAQVCGQVPLLIEIKDQDGNLGTNVGPLEFEVAQALRNYNGDVAIMSFNPNSVAAFVKNDLHISAGLVTDRFEAADWPTISQPTRLHLRGMKDLKKVGASFISHNQKYLHDLDFLNLKLSKIPILCWTVLSLKSEKKARKIADNITFEGYLA